MISQFSLTDCKVFVKFMAKPTVRVEFECWRTRLLFLREGSIFVNESNLFLFDVQNIGPPVEDTVGGYSKKGHGSVDSLLVGGLFIFSECH